MSQRKNKSIRKPVLILVEGLDYFHFLCPQVDNPAFHDVQLWDFMEGSDLSANLELLQKERGYEAVRAIGLIRDAETDRHVIEQSIRAILANRGFVLAQSQLQMGNGNPRVGYLIMPHDQNSGCLETACIASASNAAAIQCAENYYHAVVIHRAVQPNGAHAAKMKAHSYVAGVAPNAAMTLGQSVLTGIWNLQHPSMKVMIDFIESVANANAAQPNAAP